MFCAIFNFQTRSSANKQCTFSSHFLINIPFLRIKTASVQKKEDFSIWLLNTALYIHQAMNRERDNTMKQVIREARQYILEHYQEPELSVEQICRHLHMSPAYFSTMFRKETGKTYVAYLTEVRLDKAVELLNKTDDKIGRAHV